MGGEQNGHAARPIELLEELAHAVLGDHVQTDGRLVQVQHLRIVQQGCRQIATHALAERELPHRCIQELVQPEQLAKEPEIGPVASLRNAVDVAEQIERIPQRQVPPQLGALAEHDADPLRYSRATAMRGEAEYLRPTGARDQDAGQHLDGRRLAGAIRSKTGDHLAGLNGERHAGDGVDLAQVRPDQRPDRPQHAGRAARHAERPGEVFTSNHEPVLW